MTECAKSGEPLIRTMVPSEEEEAAEGYEFEPPYPFVKALVGDPPEHVKAYDVRRTALIDLTVQSLSHTNILHSCGDFTMRSVSCENPIWTTGKARLAARGQDGLSMLLYPLLWHTPRFLMGSIRI